MNRLSHHSSRSFAFVLPLLVVATLGASASASAQLPAEDSLITGPGTVLTYATYLGGAGISESINAVVTDAAGNAFVTGTVDGTIPATEDAFQSTPAGMTDAFVAKLDAAGQPVWISYFGGSHADNGSAIAVAADGSVYIAGTTLSDDLPTTPGAFQRDFKGENTGCEFACAGDAFVARFLDDGSALTYATYLGGDLNEGASALAVSAAGDALVAGWTTSPDFPTSPGAYDTTYNLPSCFDMCDADVFVARLNAAGTHLAKATFFGGTSWDSPAGLDVDADGNVYVGGSTRSTDLPTTPGAIQTDKEGKGDFDFSGFVAAFDDDLSATPYVTYFGRASEDHVTALAVGSDGGAWITGFGGRGIPTTTDALQRERRGPSDAFVTGFTPDGSALTYSTRFGGTREDYGRGIALDDQGRVAVLGSTASSDLRTRRALQPGNGGFDDLFFLRFRPGASRPQHSTYIGGGGFEAATALALSPDGSAYLAGSSESRGLPLAGRFLQADQPSNDGVLLRIDTGRLTHVKVDGRGFWQPRVRLNLGRTLVWHFANTARRSMRLTETGADLFDTKARPPGSEYYFTFPAGRFTIAHARADVVQRVAVAPVARYGDLPGTVEVRWARFPLGDDLTFDVQVKIGDGPWAAWLDGTDALGAVYEGGATDYRFRARVNNSTTGATTPWSPAGLLSAPD
ncbi:MAG: SBBP repeat-containing protein [Actinomycetota bacterium]|nr:SBBP repeat-containing protein [Actinomycetota bacterium]